MATATYASQEGIELTSSEGHQIISFPEQHYNSGVKKNDDARRMYKPVVRILKNVRNDLVERQVITDKHMPSFFLESLVWNVLPHTHFHKETYKEAVEAVIGIAWNDMRNPAKANQYKEVSELIWLFQGHEQRTPKQAEDFMLHAWQFLH